MGETGEQREEEGDSREGTSERQGGGGGCAVGQETRAVTASVIAGIVKAGRAISKFPLRWRWSTDSVIPNC